MPDYKKMYFKLAPKTADAVEALEKITALKDYRITDQRECEEIYVESKIIEIKKKSPQP